MELYSEGCNEKEIENNFNGIIQTTNPQICHQDKQLKLSPLLLFNKLRPKKSNTRKNNVSFEEPESKNTSQEANCVGEHVTFNSRCSSVSTNERLNISFYIYK